MTWLDTEIEHHDYRPSPTQDLYFQNEVPPQHRDVFLRISRIGAQVFAQMSETTSESVQGFNPSKAKSQSAMSNVSSENAVQTDSHFEWLQRRMNFLVYDWKSLGLLALNSNSSDGNDPEQTPGPGTAWSILRNLSNFLFKQKKFIAKLSSENPDDLFFEKIFAQREGHVHAIAIIYGILAESMGLNLNHVHLHPLGLLKFTHLDQTFFIDLTQNGELLSSQQVLERMHQSVASENPALRLLEYMTGKQCFLEYLQLLKCALQKNGQLESLLLVLNQIQLYQPSNLNTLVERAFVFKGLGQNKNALADVKRYLSFADARNVPEAVLDLHRTLMPPENLTPPI